MPLTEARTRQGNEPAAETQYELVFRVIGNRIARDHGYPLYSALKKILDVPPGLRISHISGQHCGSLISLNRYSKLRFRGELPTLAHLFNRLHAKQLRIGQNAIRLTTPEFQPLRQAEVLRSPIVIFKLKQISERFPEHFQASLDKALKDLEIDAVGYIASQPNGDLDQRALKVKGYKLGFAVMVENLSPADSIKLQRLGLGALGHHGAGWFAPIYGQRGFVK